MQIKTLQVSGIQSAFHAMRDPFMNWDKSDSSFKKNGNFIIGEKDMDLARRLVKAGSEHRKFLRFIDVSAEIVAPVYFLAELDTYKVSTVRSSSSLMHTGLKADKKYTMDNFSTSYDLFDEEYTEVFESVINQLNTLVEKYKNCNTEDKEKYLLMFRQLVPMGYNYNITWHASYEVLINMYNQRKTHRLPEWREEFCKWIEQLPLMDAFLNE